MATGGRPKVALDGRRGRHSGSLIILLRPVRWLRTNADLGLDLEVIYWRGGPTVDLIVRAEQLEAVRGLLQGDTLPGADVLLADTSTHLRAGLSGKLPPGSRWWCGSG